MKKIAKTAAKKTSGPPATVAAYHAAFPRPARTRLDELRRAVERAAPLARGSISWRMPTYRMHKIILSYAAFTHHVTLFVMPAAIEAFREELEGRSLCKAGIRFPLDKRIPATLVGKLVRFRVRMDMERAAIAAHHPRPARKGAR